MKTSSLCYQIMLQNLCKIFYNHLYLIKGGIIKGRIFGPDGITPFSSGVVKVLDGFVGKNSRVSIQQDGFYEISGIGYPTTDIYDYIVEVMPDRKYADAVQVIRLKTGEKKDNLNFILGSGKINIKGRVLNKDNNSPIPNARVIVLSLDRHIDKEADGRAYTDAFGEYSIQSFLNDVDVSIAVFHDDYIYEKIHKRLHIGDNVFDFSLTPRKK